MMQQQRNAEELVRSTEATASQSLVIDDEEEGWKEQQEIMHVHFARIKPSLTLTTAGARGVYTSPGMALAKAAAVVHMNRQACQSHCLGLITVPCSTVSLRI
jgi:hypothetical protein